MLAADAPAAATPAALHARRVAAGFAADDAQIALAARLTDLQSRLLAARRPARAPLLDRLLRRRRPLVKGLYLWGGVGRGKTYLMDLFHDALPFEDKQRLHFHRFMRRVHADLARFAGRPDPLRLAAGRFAREARVLCFDEFHVCDIGDAMLLAELLRHLFEAGVTLVATSNTPPRRLYEGGLQRRRFLPAIDLIERHADVVHVGGDTDYRLAVLRRDGIYHIDPGGPDNPTGSGTRALRASLRALGHGEAAENCELAINKRTMRARYCAEGVVWFDFDAICDGPRSHSDYVELARLFSTVAIDGVPVFDARREDQARRFIGLIDEFYDRNVKLLLCAAADIDGLYRGGRFAAEFERTRSRLREMRSDAYLHRTHRP